MKPTEYLKKEKKAPAMILRLSAELRDQVKAASLDHRVSMNAFIAGALVYYLESLEKYKQKMK